MTTPDYAAIRARLDAATPGPWEADDPIDGDSVVMVPGLSCLGHCPDCGTRAGFDPGDADLIAHAPADLAALLVENQRLRDAIQAVRDEVERTWPDEGSIHPALDRYTHRARFLAIVDAGVSGE